MKINWKTCPKPLKSIVYFILGALGIALLGFLFGLIIKLLWNWLMPEIFGLKEITYWQGMGLFILGRILFGGLNDDKDSDTSSKNYNHNKKREKFVEVNIEDVD